MDEFLNPDIFGEIQSYLTPYERIRGRSTGLFTPDEEAIYYVTGSQRIPDWVRKIQTGPEAEDEDIMHLDLTYLDINFNNNITNRSLSLFDNLKVLNAGINNMITDDALISPLISLTIPAINKTRLFEDAKGRVRFAFTNNIVPHISTLEFLNLHSNQTGIRDLGLLYNLKVLYVPQFIEDKNLVGLDNLEELHLTYNQTITDVGIFSLPRLKYLFIDYNANVTGLVTLLPLLEMVDLGHSRIRKKNIKNLDIIIQREGRIYDKKDIY